MSNLIKQITLPFMILGFLSLLTTSSAQTIADFNLLQGAFRPVNTVKKYVFAEQAAKQNEYAWLFAKAFILYKKNISSQDLNACNFAPSCSEYAMISVKELGIIKGVLNGFDRLTRCHPGARSYYKSNETTYKLADSLLIIR